VDAEKRLADRAHPEGSGRQAGWLPPPGSGKRGAFGTTARSPWLALPWRGLACPHVRPTLTLLAPGKMTVLAPLASAIASPAGQNFFSRAACRAHCL